MSVLDQPDIDVAFDGEAQGLKPLNKHSAAYANSIFVKSGQGILYGFTARSSNASAQFIQVHDTQAVPASGAVPCVVVDIAATATTGALWLPGRTFLYGCWIVNSTTAPTYTAGAADTFFDVQYL